VSTILTVPMFLEDFGLFLIGRYTTWPLWAVIVGIVGLGLVFGAATRLNKAKKFLGE